MNWRRISNWHEESECGRYSVAASRVGGKYVFQAWRRGDVATLLHTDTDAQACREACAAHALGRDVVDDAKEG